MEVKIGDIYDRHSDGKMCTVKGIDHTMVVLALENGRLALTDIFGLEKGYNKKESKPAQEVL